MVRLAASSLEIPFKNPSNASVQELANDNYLKELRFSLAHNLQASLDLKTTLEMFVTSIKDLVKVSSLTYNDESLNQAIIVGKPCKHTVAYNLSSDEVQLGSLEFSRGKHFLETELAALEMLIGALFFPLRNALLYRRAIESSMQDALTKIGNRAALDMSFERELKLAKRHNHPFAVLLIDVDYFKQINDNRGHLNGDKTLQQIVNSIKNTLRETDQVFRYGGEEFVALLQNTDSRDAKLIAERLRINVAMSPISLDKQDLFCTISVGVSMFEGDDTPKSLLEKADKAMYVAKNTGRNRVQLWSENMVQVKNCKPASYLASSITK
ncbi:GGDEF domain-containing protein [Agarilytica rhodophyticola]|uniref:GGDEF domain-containing protein n=1 Tax=Agarilytica rhodophyticola TaxID=1737490 RepID=UPI000B3492EF|nr:GGDEF domain-containing protein [Agarilytica rhodophyticola]